MKFLFVLAALAVAAFSLPSICNSYSPWDLKLDVWTRFNSSASSRDVFCLQYSMTVTSTKYAYVSLRRLNRFNDSSSYLYFCSSIYSTVYDSACSSVDSSYSYYADKTYNYVYGRIDYYPSGVDRSKLIYFDMKNFQGTSARDWEGYCPQGNCDSHGACIDGTCKCDAGHSDCDIAGLVDWIIYLIVIFVIILILIPVIIIICCCCCGVCAVAAAAAH